MPPVFFSTNPTARKNAAFGQGSDPIWLDNLKCTGSEADLTQCPSGPTAGCDHSEDAGVVCQCKF